MATSPEASSAETVNAGPATSSWLLIRFAGMFGIVPTTPAALSPDWKASRAAASHSGSTASPAPAAQPAAHSATRQRAP